MRGDPQQRDLAKRQPRVGASASERLGHTIIDRRDSVAPRLGTGSGVLVHHLVKRLQKNIPLYQQHHEPNFDAARALRRTCSYTYNADGALRLLDRPASERRQIMEQCGVQGRHVGFVVRVDVS